MCVLGDGERCLDSGSPNIVIQSVANAPCGWGRYRITSAHVTARLRMGEGDSLIDVGGLADPATRLVDRVSDAIGALYEPTRIRRHAEAEADATRTEAEAEADARLIRAEAEAEERELAARAEHRLERRELRRQRNIEQITAGAADAIEGEDREVQAEDVSEDWLYRFFESCQDIGDEEIQRLWSRVLAGQFSHPGRFSYRALNTLRLMDKTEAEIFELVGDHCWEDSRGVPILWLTPGARDHYSDHGVTRGAIEHLETVGLLNTDRVLSSEEGVEMVTCYGDRCYKVLRTAMGFAKGSFVGVGYFTSIGLQLYRLLSPEPDDEFREVMVQEFREMDGIDVTEVEIAADG